MKTPFRRICAWAAAIGAFLPLLQAAAPQSVAITSHADGSSLIAASPGVTLTADAVASTSGTIASVDFRVNGTSVGTDTSAPYSATWMPSAPGTYTLTAIATDSTGTPNTLTSSAVTVTVSAVRTVSIGSPAANATFPQGSATFVRATATMTDGIVRDVEFVLNGSGGPVSLGVDDTAPFAREVTFTGAPGSYTLTAIATATNGATFSTTAIPITIAPAVGNGPTVTLTAPTASAVIGASSNVTVSATASDPDAGGSITGVTFFADGEQIGSTDTTAPYSVTWTPALVKSYVLTAQAADNNSNLRLSAPVTVTVRASAPTVSVTAPAAGFATGVGVPTTVTANATATNGATLTGVEFFANGVSLGTDNLAPYSISWTPGGTGSVALTARATDSNGVTVTSDPVNGTVGNTAPPTVTITAPTGGGSVSTGANITVSANATVSAGLSVASVSFTANGAPIGTDTTSPYSITWTPTTLGTTVLLATVTDSVGATAISSPVSVTAITPSGALAVTLTGSSSMPGGSTRLFTATPTPSTGVDRVELLYDDTIIATDTTAPYSFLFTAPNVIGPHRLNARVVDVTGATATSAAFQVNVTGASGSPPTVGIATPTANAFLAPNTATTISGSMADADGTVTGVQVYVNDTLLAATPVLAGGTWTVAWTTPSTPGPVSIVAIATDNSGNSVASPAVGVTIADSSSPAISLGISPVVAGQAASTTFPSGAVRNFVANVTPSSGRAVVRVEFFVDGTKVGEDTSAPYTFRYTAPALAAGEQSRSIVFAARATDNAGAARDVQVPLLVVQPIGQPPTVNLLTPANGAAVVPNSAVSLAATAVGNGGTIASVQFYVNGSPANINGGNALTAPPYTATFTPTAPGTYVVDAIATDDRGNTTVSNAATITAAFATPTVALTSPNPNATARATPNVPLNLAASAVVQPGAGAAILLVEFLLDGVQIGADTTAPYTFSWTPTTAQIGQHVLTARVTDTNSQTATSAPVTVNVAPAVGTPPTITISTSPIPAQGLQTLSQVNFLANAFANGTNSTLQSVEFFLNDQSIGTATREQSTNIYRLVYDFSRFDFTTLTANETTGRFTVPLYAIARDSNNNQTVSSTSQLSISPSTSAPPTFTQPVQNVTGTNNITQGQQFLAGVVTADTDGTVTLLQLYANGQIVASQANPAQAQLLFWTANTPGRYNMIVVATDDTGNTAVSLPAIVINVTAVSAPTTTITRPSDDSTVTTVNAPVFLEGTAVNNDTNQVPTLNFIAVGQGGARQTIPATRVGTTTTYRAIWTPTTPDTYSVSTQANIGNTAQGTSTASRRVVVTNLQGIAPSVTINVPNSATTASQAGFIATATDSDGSVVEVEFFLNRNSIGKAVRDDLANTWRLTASFAGLQPGSVEVVALARDSTGNVAASPTSNITVTAASSIAPSITIEPSTTNAAFNRQIQLRANARDSDGTIGSVTYFANGTQIGQSTNANTNYQVNWTPTQSGTFNVWAVATDNTGITTVASTVRISVRRNNPIQEDSAFILQSYQDIANTTNINPLIFDDLDARLSSGAISRADLVMTLLDEPGFLPPVQLLATYYVIMGQWPTPANYNALIGTARGSLSNAVGDIIASNEYRARYPEQTTPTTALLNNPASVIPARTFGNRIWANAGRGGTMPDLELVRFMNNTTTANNTIGRGYNSVGLNTAIAEFVTLTNASNTALFNQARAAALFYQLDRPPVTMTVDQITARVAQLVALNDTKAMIDSVLKDTLYRYRYVTITRHPESLTVAPRSGVLFSVEADGAPPLAYQWLLNGAPIAGATNALLSLTNVDATRVGTYTAVVTSSAGSSTSDPATLTLSSTPTRLANISTRGVTSGGANVLIGGFVVTGTNAQQTRQMLIRVIGPTLAQAPFNVQGTLADPRIEIYSAQSTSTPVLTNDNWGTQAGGAAQVTAIQQATTRAGAFALPNNSADAVVLATLPPGLYTVQAKGPANNPNATGVVLIEAYDVTTGNAAGPKAANVSTRGQVGTGTNIMIAGFVVNGAVSRRMLIRGAGPTLANLGVPGVLADPQITLVEQSSGRTIKTNDNWASGDDAAIIAQASAAAGAFSLANGSRDSAMLVMLAPGAYTVQLSGVGNTTGIGIVEVYDVDP